ncbi:MAG: SGNH/GDSL hydrolase family protein [bacterium]
MRIGMVVSLSVAISVAVAVSTVCAEGLEIKAGEQIVAIGDSITAAGGYLRDMDTVFAKQYPELKLPRIINTGIGGQKAENLVPRFERDVIKRKPAIVTIDIGINDVWHRQNAPHDPNVLKAYKENVTKMVDAAQAAGIRVVLCTPTVITEDLNSEGNKRLVMYCDAIKQIAVEKKCMLADLHEIFVKVIGGKPADQKGNAITSDGVHMNGPGDWLMAQGILNTLGVPQDKIEAAKK